jgi:hypothetical protein
MKNVKVYEYYEGYEHLWADLPKKQRNKVQYFILGKTLSGNIIICYCGNFSWVTIIGPICHRMAWKKTKIDLKQAIKHLHADITDKRNYVIFDGKRHIMHQLINTITNIDKIIKNLEENKAFIDKEHHLEPKHSGSCRISSDIRFSYDYGESYTEKMIEAYLNRKEILQIRDKFYDKLLSDIADNMYLHAKVKLIQRQFRLANTNPNYIICQHRLLREFNNMHLFKTNNCISNNHESSKSI